MLDSEGRIGRALLFQSSHHAVIAEFDTAKRDDPLAYPVASAEVMSAFPPTLFISGTRSFEFSMALDSHNELASAGVRSHLHGWDGMNHAFFYNSELPESREAYAIMVDFFETYLAD